MNLDKSKLNNEKAANHLIHETSTYLRQHAFNPVNWYAWTNEALALAIHNDKPIMLSIGYSACHWCHVMEEESFEDEVTAKLINENFIPIKVDREERPDLDDIYMSAVQLMTGHGGWPLTVFLTPQQKPFYGGTYFPKEDRHYGNHILPGFQTVLKAVSKAWQDKRADIEDNGEHLVSAITAITQAQIDNANLNLGPKENDNNLLIQCATKILPLFDLQWGGIGKAPKFPQTLTLQMCLQAAAKLKKQDKADKTAEHILEALSITLDCIAQGGIYDQLAGGFARYSTDEKWLVPHFEKMLYDNALLAQVYLDAFIFTQKESWKTIACETLDFIANELTSEEGGFYSSLDADSEGVEGKFYTWKKSEIQEILGRDSELFCQFFSVTDKGNFENGQNILYISLSNNSEQSAKIKALKVKLLAERQKRIRPIRDDKMLTSWTSLAISAFVKGYQISANDKYAQLAKNAAQFILNKLVIDGKLKRSYAHGTAKLDAYLDDYAFFCKALIDLSSIDSNPIWLEKALSFSDTLLAQFFEQHSADFFYTGKDHEKLITRPKNYLDGPIPSATSIAVLCLLQIHLIVNDEKYEQTALQVLEKYKHFFLKQPTQYASMISTFALANSSPLSLILVKSTNNLNNEMLLAPFFCYLPNATVFIKDTESFYNKKLLLFQHKDTANNQISAYICQNNSCQPPTNDPNRLKVLLQNCQI